MDVSDASRAKAFSAIDTDGFPRLAVAPKLKYSPEVGVDDILALVILLKFVTPLFLTKSHLTSPIQSVQLLIRLPAALSDAITLGERKTPLLVLFQFNG